MKNSSKEKPKKQHIYRSQILKGLQIDINWLFQGRWERTINKLHPDRIHLVSISKPHLHSLQFSIIYRVAK